MRSTASSKYIPDYPGIAWNVGISWYILGYGALQYQYYVDTWLCKPFYLKMGAEWAPGGVEGAG